MGSNTRKRDKLVPIRLDEKELSVLRSRADKVGVTIPAYLRGLALRDRPPIINKKNWEDIYIRLFDIIGEVDSAVSWAHFTDKNNKTAVETLNKLSDIREILTQINNTMLEIKDEAEVKNINVTR